MTATACSRRRICWARFTYNSLADLDANRPASFTRSLSPRDRSGSSYVGAISLGDSYRRSADFQLQYGLRVDANRFDRGPTYNADLEQAFGVRNDRVPDRVYLSPRVGFSWRYGTAAQIGAFEGAFRGPRAIVRGGVGVFQNTPQATLIGQALDATGLASGLQQITCVGPAAPMPELVALRDERERDPDTLRRRRRPARCSRTRRRR